MIDEIHDADDLLSVVRKRKNHDAIIITHIFSAKMILHCTYN